MPSDRAGRIRQRHARRSATSWLTSGPGAGDADPLPVGSVL